MNNKSGLPIRILIQLGQWIRIQIQEGISSYLKFWVAYIESWRLLL